MVSERLSSLKVVNAQTIFLGNTGLWCYGEGIRLAFVDSADVSSATSASGTVINII